MIRGQTTLILMVFVLIIFLGIVIVLLSFAQQISPLEYLNIYTHDLLVSTLRTDVSGPDCPKCWQDVKCKTMADLLKCSVTTPGWICPSATQTCAELANDRITAMFDQYEQVKGWTWLVLITGEGDFVPVGGPYQFIPPESEIMASQNQDLQQLLNWTKRTAGLPGRPARAPRIDVLTATELITVSPGNFLKVMVAIKR